VNTNCDGRDAYSAKISPSPEIPNPKFVGSTRPAASSKEAQDACPSAEALGNRQGKKCPWAVGFLGFLSSWLPDSLIRLKPMGQAPSPAPPQIRPPPVSQHLREFAANPHAWAALARNLIPVVGIYVFGRSAALAVFSYWFDGLTALAAIIAAVVLRLLREMPAWCR
jgi:hypothetical protein